MAKSQVYAENPLHFILKYMGYTKQLISQGRNGKQFIDVYFIKDGEETRYEFWVDSIKVFTYTV